MRATPTAAAWRAPAKTADSAVTEAAITLHACAINELRLLRILKSLHLAALDGRTWGWSAAEFALTLHGKQDDGAKRSCQLI